MLSDVRTMARTRVLQDIHLQHGCTSRPFDKPTVLAQVIQPPETAPQKGPSRVGLAVLLGAGLLLVATWHKLTSRCSSEPQHMLGTGLACGTHVCCARGCLSALQKRVLPITTPSGDAIQAFFCCGTVPGSRDWLKTFNSMSVILNV